MTRYNCNNQTCLYFPGFIERRSQELILSEDFVKIGLLMLILRDFKRSGLDVTELYLSICLGGLSCPCQDSKY
jgi:hypothetical protein